MITIPAYKTIEKAEEHMSSVPYDVTRQKLYSVRYLYKGYNRYEPLSLEQCYDQHVYRHFINTGRKANCALGGFY